jgi:hypothetical protein
VNLGVCIDMPAAKSEGPLLVLITPLYLWYMATFTALDSLSALRAHLVGAWTPESYIAYAADPSSTPLIFLPSD